MIKLTWKNEEIEYLKNNFLSLSYKDISKQLGRSPNAVRIKSFRLGIGKLKSRIDIKLSEEEHQIILGGLLGDLYCRISGSCKNAQIEGAHCKKQEPYLLWKVSKLKNLSFSFRRTNLGYLFFESRRYPCLNYYCHLFYKTGKKKINVFILNKLNRLGLAIWYMDDGSYNKRYKYCRLHTNGFTYDENLIIKKWFEEKWGIYSKINSCKQPKKYPGRIWYYLNFNSTETRKLIGLVEDYVHPSMEYKIGINKEGIKNG